MKRRSGKICMGLYLKLKVLKGLEGKRREKGKKREERVLCNMWMIPKVRVSLNAL